MTAQQYYDSQYGYFMGDQEREAIEDAPDEEMIVTPDDDDKEMLDQGIIDATNKRVQQDQKRRMKENKITWKNYKNRKKMLA
jgi:DNA-binding protein YbaB